MATPPSRLCEPGDDCTGSPPTATGAVAPYVPLPTDRVAAATNPTRASETAEMQHMLVQLASNGLATKLFITGVPEVMAILTSLEKIAASVQYDPAAVASAFVPLRGIRGLHGVHWVTDELTRLGAHQIRASPREVARSLQAASSSVALNWSSNFSFAAVC